MIVMMLHRICGQTVSENSFVFSTMRFSAGLTSSSLWRVVTEATFVGLEAVQLLGMPIVEI